MAVTSIQIIRAIESQELTLRTLSSSEIICDDRGNPRYSIGNSAVIFLAQRGDQRYSLKCYCSPCNFRKKIYGNRLHSNELFIPQEDICGEWIDIVMDRWVEGVSLGEYLAQCVACDDRAALCKLSNSFDTMALDLLSKDWAHGDITCDNIIVSHDGELTLIDFDASFVPSLAGELSSELGTKSFQHPRRDANYFDRTIDDFSIALISTALAAISLDPTLYSRYSVDEGLLYDPSKSVCGECEALEETLNILARSASLFAYAVAKMLQSPTPYLPDLYLIMHYKVEGIPSQATPKTIFSRDGLWGFVNEFGREVIPPIFDSALNFSEGLSAVKIGHAWHYVDQRARIIINCSEYLALKSFRNGTGRGLTSNGWVEIKKS